MLRVRLDGLLAEEELLSNLPVRSSVDDESSDLELALGQRLAAGRRGSCAGTTVDSLPELVDGVVAAPQVLDVDRREDVNAGGEDLRDVLVALGVLEAGRRWCARARR
jgi:hypothetical protein